MSDNEQSDDVVHWEEWAQEQLNGVMREDDPRYKLERQRMGLITIVCEEMRMQDADILIPHYSAEWAAAMGFPCWAWLI